MIKQLGQRYIVVSETTERSFGTYRTLAEAKKRLWHIEFFKHVTK